ncbi:EcoAI/FtnUII family type I restriction enzme subunit R [Desulfuromonas thiophila]|uniref:Type I restriction enzyme, R subunit n=1 Tax=Desulfuromonas thiophila TaxID=57664 RepID=A0A1G7DYF6_9BACT|nr:type I restriction endonuclease subunit R [Desulfuromonas thiophila]SDE56452.1 type I restriction enzyme, R subunit [Desulfuromonas thiophila]
MNEADTRAELIDPALKASGWGVVEGSRVRREVITLGRLQGAGKRSKQDIADYVLIYRGQKLAVIEAKRRDLPDTEGVAQAKRYAAMLQTRFTYATNGGAIYQIDMETGQEGYVNQYPSPDELWAMTYAEESEWRDRFAAVPFEDKSGQWQPRYYQHNAINKALEAIVAGKDRILLTLATGTGKTAIAFQIAWKLFHSRWTLSRDGNRRPRILFLADRNILADQAYNAFSAFPEDALVRIDPEIIRKKGMVPKNGSVFFTIFQTFMTGRDADGNPAPSFGDYPPEFFDIIIIDECHRGGANDESNWRSIMEYFSPAVQLGLTATPKRTTNADTYHYFGEPVYIYSLKEGINDGFLTPFKVQQIATTLDEYVYTSDDRIIEGEIEEGKRYGEDDFNKIIEIREREAYRVKIFMEMIDQKQKTLVFCATQDHAAAVRDLINQMKTSTDPNYCVRVTARDGAEGERWLRTFQDNEKTIPTILTTSQKLSTGVDARNVRNIVLMRPVNSMIEFKQIVGRGTRLFDGKDYFTIYDFVQAYKHFSDPEWDGEPEEPEAADSFKVRERPAAYDPADRDSEPEDAPKKREKIKIRLADGKERTIQHMMASSFWSPDGKPMSAAQFIEQLYGELPALFKNEDELRILWGDPATRKSLLGGLAEKGFGDAQLAEAKLMINAEQSDVFDVLAYIAFALPPISRSERVAAHWEAINSRYHDKQRAFLAFVLGEYVRVGIEELDVAKLAGLLQLQYGNVSDAAEQLGGIAQIRETFVGFQRCLYARIG